MRSLPVSAIPRNGFGGVPMDMFIRYDPSIGKTGACALGELGKEEEMDLKLLMREIERRMESRSRSYLSADGLCSGEDGESRWTRSMVKPAAWFDDDSFTDSTMDRN